MRRLPIFLALAAAPVSRAADEIVFNRDIRPILSEHCFHCHGPDENTREAKLRLDQGEAAHAEVLVAGRPEESELWLRMVSDDEEDLMPPPEMDKPLDEDQIALLRRWIESGAEYQDHWGFITPERPTVPGGHSAIDHFVAERISGEAVEPTGKADRRVLLRRVALDLTGLPPTPEEVEAFVADTSPQAWERVVDRLLDSPRYGEHMARYWLDAVRYGDTHGLHLDNYREMWPYRDWVVRAFNDNKGWDEFVTEQLAGDLLENPTTDQLVATGFNRAHVTTSEGGSIREEVYVRNVTDRVGTFGTVMLGLTAECASCHDHKFDPITQREFYQLFAYFNNLDAKAVDGNRKDHLPVVPVPGPEGERKLEVARKEIAEKRVALIDAIAAYDYREPEDASQEPEVVETVWTDDEPPSGATLQGNWDWVESVAGKPPFSGKRAMKRSGAGNTQHVANGVRESYGVAEDSVLFAHVFLADPAPKQVMLQFHSSGWEHRAYWGENKIDWGKDKTPSRHRVGDLPETGKWVRLEVPAKDVGLKAGDTITGWAFTQFDGVSFWDKAGISGGAPAYRSFARWLADEKKREASTLPADLEPLLEKDQVSRTAQEQQQLLAHYIAKIDVDARSHLAPLEAAIASAEQKLADIEKSFPTSLIWKERAERRTAYVLERGLYDQRGDEVQRALPDFLPPLPEGAPNNRLGIAQWLVAPEHPLTARVAVNRFWQQFFGVGLVKTAEDFGSQAEWPSHPELLDWLAVEFRESGWDAKALVKQIVMSETYRRSSAATPEDYRQDPENRLLARGPRFRLDAESLRDQALAVSGLLVEKLGGPGVKPPQPDGLWHAVAYTTSNTSRFKADSGPDKVHRRSLYTFWKRTAPPPQMIDAPPRESCVVRRERTNTPLQALMFMNDPQFVEAARAFAERFESEPDDAIPAKLYAHALARTPTERELTLLRESYDEHLAHYQANPDAAKALIAIGDAPSTTTQPERLAAWTMVASLVLNLDEFVTKN